MTFSITKEQLTELKKIHDLLKSKDREAKKLGRDLFLTTPLYNELVEKKVFFTEGMIEGYCRYLYQTKAMSVVEACTTGFQWGIPAIINLVLFNKQGSSQRSLAYPDMGVHFKKED